MPSSTDFLSKHNFGDVMVGLILNFYFNTVGPNNFRENERDGRKLVIIESIVTFAG